VNAKLGPKDELATTQYQACLKTERIHHIITNNELMLCKCVVIY